MPETRAAHKRNASEQSASQEHEDSQAAGSKRKADDVQETTEPKAQKTESSKKQTTLEESMPQAQSVDVEMKDQDEKAIEDVAESKKEEPSQANGNSGDVGEAPKKEEIVKEEPAASQAKGEEQTSGDAIEKSSERKEAMPSNILEKGVIYFFTRPRVGIEDAESVGDLQRTFFVLRPLAKEAKLTDGAIPDSKTNRLLALPKKTFPKSHSDRFMAFVEKAPVSMEELRESFFGGSEYETKTAGTRHTHPVTPVGEGVYAITSSSDRSTHLAYMLTVPNEPSEVQDDLGLRAKGSFVISIKNPTRSGPASASLPQPPSFPKEIIEEFRGLAWTEVRPQWLDYPNAQILLIGERNDGQGELGKAVEVKPKDQKAGKAEPAEELEKLEHEDEMRVQHLHGDDTIFDDLKISSQEYPKVPSTW